jgi:hypothetical protein
MRGPGHRTVGYGAEWPFTLVDRASGDVLLEGNLMDGEFDQRGEGPRPTHLVATTDGSSWLSVDFPGTSPAQAVSARNGDVVVAVNGTNWLRYDLESNG